MLKYVQNCKVVATIKYTHKIYLTQKNIKMSLIDLLKHKSLSKITIDEICDNAGITRGTIYRYYKGKEEIINTIEDEMIATIKQAGLNNDLKSNEEMTINNLLPLLQSIDENKKIIHILMSNNAQPSSFFQKIKQLVGSSEFFKGQNDEKFQIVKRLEFGFIIQTLHTIADPERTISLYDIAVIFINVLNKGIFPTIKEMDNL